MVILGIDPGTTRIGYGAIQKDGATLIYITSGALIIKGNTSEKLVSLEQTLSKLLKDIRPERVGVEKLFFSKNKKTALDVAQARGVIICSIARQAIPIIEVSPSEMKLAVTGDGRASKAGVAKMVRQFLNVPTEQMLDDVTDALGVAISISNQRG